MLDNVSLRHTSTSFHRCSSTGLLLNSTRSRSGSLVAARKAQQGAESDWDLLAVPLPIRLAKKISNLGRYGRRIRDLHRQRVDLFTITKSGLRALQTFSGDIGPDRRV